MQRAKEVKQAEEALAQSAEVRRITREMRSTAASKPCGVCGEDICELEGIYCPSKEHFLCDECFTMHVKSQSETAEDFVPYDAGEVWCVCKPVQGNGGCTSERAFTPKASSLSNSDSSFPCMPTRGSNLIRADVAELLLYPGNVIYGTHREWKVCESLRVHA